MRRLTLTVTPEQAGRTVKSLLRRELRMADGAIARVKTVPDGICLNGAHARTVDRVAAGDTLTVRIDDKRSGGRFSPVAVPLDILYEDADLLALNKPAGMAVHGGYDRGDPTVANALAAYLGPDAVFHPVNRLDRGTSGVMLVARSGYVHDRLRRVLHTDGFRRTYLAAACGTGLPVSGTIDLPISRQPGSLLKRSIDPDGLPSRTEYEVLSVSHGRTLLRLRPITGRTHQLRLHMTAIGHPLTGDWLYGAEDKALITRPALHSYELWLRHPLTKDLLHITAPIPEDMQRLL